MRRLAITANLFVLALLASCKPRVAEAASLPMTITATELPAASADSVRYALAWRVVADANGAATSYLDSVFAAGALVHARSTTATADTFSIARPAAGQSVALVARVRAVRRGLASAPASLAWTYTSPDAPPPAPDSLKADTIAVRLSFTPAAVTVAVGDSVRLHVTAWNAAGDTIVLSSVGWTNNTADSARVVPIAGTPNAWIVGVIGR